MLVLRTTDRIPCKIGELKLWITPLSWDERTRIFSLGKNKESQMAFETLRASIKKVEGHEGYTLSDGSTFSPGFDEQGKIDIESLELIIRIAGYDKFSMLAGSLIAETLNEKLSGVEIDLENVENIQECGKKKA
jgi:hypothetical protein